MERVLDGKAGARRTMGRPERRCLESAKKDLKQQKVNTWRRAATDRGGMGGYSEGRVTFSVY